jgi:diamine N-acetyltransferase
MGLDMDNSAVKVSLRPLNRFNWETAVSLKVYDYQEDFMPPVLYTIAQSKFEDIQLFGIFQADTMVGFISYGNFGGVFWVNRILVDQDHQQQGIGREALKQVLERLQKHPDCKEIRTSFARQNAIAEYFFRSMGFQRINDSLEGEIVMAFNR